MCKSTNLENMEYKFKVTWGFYTQKLNKTKNIANRKARITKEQTIKYNKGFIELWKHLPFKHDEVYIRLQRKVKIYIVEEGGEIIWSKLWWENKMVKTNPQMYYTPADSDCAKYEVNFFFPPGQHSHANISPLLCNISSPYDCVLMKYQTSGIPWAIIFLSTAVAFPS